LYGAWEEYRYDALGRRILVRTNAERYATTYCDGDGINPRLNAPYAPRQCVARVRRIVWDGDQELYEIQAPAWDQPTDNYLTPKLENDTTSATNGADSRFYGRVAYTHGLELDHPLNAIRMGYSHSLWGTTRSWQDSALVITPHWTWRGIPDDGSFADGGALHCKTPSDPTHQTCVLLNWSFGLDARLYKLQQPLGWFGSLLDQRTDATGDQNMRNRNYDPLSGRFTQEDPIGLAGGLNVYGFAAGDPVSYSDPFGLCPLYDHDDNWNDCDWGRYFTDRLIDLGNAIALGSLLGGIEEWAASSEGATVAESPVNNPVPATFARAIPAGLNAEFLASPATSEAFVTDAAAIRGLDATRISAKLGIDPSPSGYQIIEFSSKDILNIASPINRTNPKFVGRGLTIGGAPEFVIPNRRIPADAVRRLVPR
jgi:RHS repeat-associated protein